MLLNVWDKTQVNKPRSSLIVSKFLNVGIVTWIEQNKQRTHVGKQSSKPPLMTSSSWLPINVLVVLWNSLLNWNSKWVKEKLASRHYDC